MNYLIRVTENICSKEGWDIVDCPNKDEAYNIGTSMATELIGSNPEAINEVISEANQAWEYEGQDMAIEFKDSWIDETIADIMVENSNIEIYPLIDGAKIEDGASVEEILEKYGVKTDE